MFKNQRISTLLGFAFGTLLAVMLLIGAITFFGDMHSRKLSDQAAEKAKTALQVSDLARLQIKQVAVARSYMMTGSEADLKRYNDNSDDYKKIYAELLNKLKTPEEQKLLQDLADVYNPWEKETLSLLQMKKEGREQDLLDRQKTGIPAKLSTPVNTAVAKISAYEGEQMTNDFENQKSSQTTKLWITCLIVLSSFLLAGFAGVTTTRVIGERLQEAKIAIQTVARKDLTAGDVEVTIDDPLGEASQSINEMKRSLTDVMSRLAMIAGQVAGASTELAATAREATQGAHNQRSETEHVAATIEEMTASIEQMAEHTENISRAASLAAESAREGDETMSNAVKLIAGIAEQVGKVAAVVEELEQNSKSIGNIVNVIEEIAGQTNLLALNAAIEAARAGEQGRGFAVVAGEVRRLAERTSGATREIGAIITTVQQNTERAATEMQIGKTQVAEGVQKTEQTREVLVQILNSVSEVDSMMQQIAAATTEQSAATRETSRNLSRIVNLVQEASAGAQQSQAAAQELSELSSSMHGLVAEFRLPQNSQTVRFELPGEGASRKSFSKPALPHAAKEVSQRG